jgi:hypothetical protein
MTTPIPKQIDAREPVPLDVRIVRARVDAVKGWAVRWGHPRRRFRQAIWFPTREQADRLVARLRADDHGRDAQRLLTKALDRPLTTTAAERGRLGGPARAAALSPERRLEISMKANAARWALHKEIAAGLEALNAARQDASKKINATFTKLDEDLRKASE